MLCNFAKGISILYYSDPYTDHCTYIITGIKQFALLEKVITVTEENTIQR